MDNKHTVIDLLISFSRFFFVLQMILAAVAGELDEYSSRYFMANANTRKRELLKFIDSIVVPHWMFSLNYRLIALVIVIQMILKVLHHLCRVHQNDLYKKNMSKCLCMFIPERHLTWLSFSFILFHVHASIYFLFYQVPAMWVIIQL